MWEPLRLILADLEKSGYKFACNETEEGLPYFVCWRNVRCGGRVYASDTTIHIDILNPEQPGNSEYAIFCTLICEGLYRNSSESFDRAIDMLNYHYFGKFVRDYADRSQDVMYVTSINSLTLEVVAEHLLHHVEVKGTLTLGLEKLRDC